MGDGGAAEESEQFLKRSDVEILRGDRAGHRTRNKVRDSGRFLLCVFFVGYFQINLETVFQSV